MSVTFTKLFSSITESTVWCEPDKTRIVWITMLAMADRYGRVWASVPGLANRARVPVEDTRLAIDNFLSPDPDSRTKELEGRRIEAIDGGWRLLNHKKYKAIRDEEARIEYQREWDRKNRGKHPTPNPTHPTEPDTILHIAEAEAEAEAEEKTKTAPADADAAPSPFAIWWVAYPLKVGKQAAKKAYGLAVKRVSAEQPDAHAYMLERAKVFAASPKASGRFCPQPSTWLNQGRYDDDPTAWQDSGLDNGKPSARKLREAGEFTETLCDARRL